MGFQTGRSSSLNTGVAKTSVALQVLKRSAAFRGYIGCDQIPLQGHVDTGVQEADRQSKDESQGTFSLVWRALHMAYQKHRESTS